MLITKEKIRVDYDCDICAKVIVARYNAHSAHASKLELVSVILLSTPLRCSSYSTC